MPTLRDYGGLIWTNHALERLENRRLSQELAAQAFRYPDKRVSGKMAGSFEYRKRYKNSLITLIAKQNESRRWVVLSCWIDPPLPGTEDERKREAWKRYSRSSWWMKWLLTLKKSLFG